MLNFCAAHGILRLAARLACIVLFVSFSQAQARDSNESCLKDLGVTAGVTELKDWNDLQVISDAGLSARTSALIEAHPLTAQLRQRFGSGKKLAFQSEVGEKAGGWLIQGHFLLKLLKTVFPEAEILRPMLDERLLIKIEDSTFGVIGNKSAFDMVDLKMLNSSTPSLSKAQLRTQLGLPQTARVASVYDALKTSLDKGDIVRALFDKKLADIVILSAQVEVNTQRHAWHGEVPLVSVREWLTTNPAERPRRAIIYNNTYQRLPYMHAAADFVVVTGEANMFEPIHAGRPTYFDKFGWGEARGAVAWKRITGAAFRSGLGYPIAGEKDLVTHRAAHANEQAVGAMNSVDQEAALTNVLRALVEMTASER